MPKGGQRESEGKSQHATLGSNKSALSRSAHLKLKSVLNGPSDTLK